MRLTVIGSGGAVPHPSRRPPAYLLEHDGYRLLMDAGPGTLSCLAARGVHPADLSAVLVSHLHPDHALDLVHLLFHRSWAPREQVRPGLRLLGPRGFRDELSGWVEAVHAGTLSEGNADLDWVELEAQAATAGPWSVTPIPVFHRPDGPSPSLGYRLDGAPGALAYTGDTGSCPALEHLLDPRGCLLCECNGVEAVDNPAHLDPRQIRALVDRCPPALLLLTHVRAAYDTLPLPGPAFDGYAGVVEVAHDLMVVEWDGAGRPTVRANQRTPGQPPSTPDR